MSACLEGPRARRGRRGCKLAGRSQLGLGEGVAGGAAGWPEPPGRSPLHSRMASVKPVGETGREQRGKGGNGRRGWRGILHAFGGEVPRPKARGGRSEFGLGSADPPEGSEFRDAEVEGKRGKNRCPVDRLAAVTAAPAAGARRTAGGAESSLSAPGPGPPALPWM